MLSLSLFKKKFLKLNAYFVVVNNTGDRLSNCRTGCPSQRCLKLVIILCVFLCVLIALKTFTENHCFNQFKKVNSMYMKNKKKKNILSNIKQFIDLKMEENLF